MQPTTTPTNPSHTRAPVKREGAERYVLISLTCFGLTVAVTRVYLEWTGYPQIGNAELHIAHALWGGLLLFLAALLTLIVANRWAFSLSAVLSGVGVGLFIDEVGKFITQKNDYFFPPAAPIIYSAFLLMVLLFLLVRQARRASPRRSMYAVLEEFGRVLDNDLDPHARARMLADLNNGRTSPEPHIVELAEQLAAYLQGSSLPLVPYRPGIWARTQLWVRRLGEKVGRKRHRIIIMVLLAFDGTIALFVAALLLWAWFAIVLGAPNMPKVHLVIDNPGAPHPAWIAVGLSLQVLISVLNLVALVLFWRGHEHRAVGTAIFAALLAFTIVNLLNFYVSQFGALAAFFSNLAVLFVLFAYRAWYLSAPNA